MTPYGNMALRPVAWETHIRFHELKKISRNCGISDDPRKQKETSWTERADYKGRESFRCRLGRTPSILLHPQPTGLFLGKVSPILYLLFQDLPSFYSGFHQEDPFSAHVALAKPLLQVLLYWHQLWFYFCTRQRAPIFLIACLNVFLSIRRCTFPMDSSTVEV